MKSMVYDTEAISRINCKFQILNSFFYQVAPPLFFPSYLRKKSFIPWTILFGSAKSICFFKWPKSNFPIKCILEENHNNLLRIILLWINYTSFQSYQLKLHCSGLFTFFRSNNRMHISENQFPWSFVKTIEKKLVNSLTYNFTRRNGKRSFEKDFLEKFPNCGSNYSLKYI